MKYEHSNFTFSLNTSGKKDYIKGVNTMVKNARENGRGTWKHLE